MSENHPNQLTGLERLAALACDDGVEPERMTADQLAEYLQKKKVDMSAPKQRFEKALKRAKAQQKLEAAGEALARAREKLKLGIAGVKGDMRELVAGMLEKLKQRDPGQAQVYARQFEEATEEDLASLAEDLALLETDEGNDKTHS
jgi:hypothetical protein